MTVLRDRATMSPEHIRIAELAKEDRERKFSSIAHLLTVEAQHEAFERLWKDASAGVDCVTYTGYATEVRDNLEKLHDRLKQGQYRAQPLRRIYIPKEDGRQRPISIPSLEDKIVQKAAADLLNVIYEQDFLDCSYGFRPGRFLQSSGETLLYLGEPDSIAVRSCAAFACCRRTRSIASSKLRGRSELRTAVCCVTFTLTPLPLSNPTVFRKCSSARERMMGFGSDISFSSSSRYRSDSRENACSRSRVAWPASTSVGDVRAWHHRIECFTALYVTPSSLAS